MQIIQTDRTALYDDYKNIILKRDRIKKEAFEYQQQYLRVFGNLHKLEFKLQIDCIALKKKIEFCTQCVNHNKEIFMTELNQYIDHIMEEYYEDLKNLEEDVNHSKDVTLISREDVKEIKKIYYKIAKLIHPDMHPELFEKEEVKDLWNRALIAYTCNDLKELREIEVLVSVYNSCKVDIKVEDLNEKIEKIKKEIIEIKSRTPYMYKDILENRIKIRELKEKLNESIESLQDYKKQLESIYYSFKVIDLTN